MSTHKCSPYPPFMATLLVSSEIGNRIHILKFIAIYLAEIVFSNDWSENGWSELDGNISQIVRRYCADKKSYNKLKNYAREALYSLIETEWQLSNPQTLLPKGSNCWAYDYIEESQEVLLDKFISKKDGFPKTEFAKCGVLPYVIMPKIERIRKVTELSCKSNTLREQLLSLYNRIVEARATECYEYVWQWLITAEEYKSIVSLLSCAKKKQITDAIKNNVKCRQLIKIYIAEHFKREYNGQNASQNILDDYGFGTNDYKYLLGEDTDKVYRTSDEQNSWKMSLQVEGGLPIRYIVDNQNSNMASFAEDIYKDEPQEAVDSLHNSALRQSYQLQHSIYKFVSALISGSEPICSEEDKESDMYRNLYKFLEEGREKSVKNKFYLKYRIWKSKTQFSIKRTLLMRICNDCGEPTAYNISAKRLNGKWNIDNKPYTFWIKIDTTGWQYQHQFVSDGILGDGGLYRSHIRQDEFVLPKIYADDEVAPISISYMEHRENEGVEVERLDFLKDGYKQFHQVNDFEWQEGKGDGEQRSAVLYDENRWRVDDDYQVLSVAGLYGWVEFESSIKLYGKSGKIETLVDTVNGVTIVPVEGSIHPIAKLSYVDLNNGVISLEKIDGGLVIKKGYLLQQTQVKFQIIYQNGDTEYEDVDCTGFDGYKVVKVKNKNVHCYFLPSEANIRRHPGRENGTIFFDRLQVDGANDDIFYDTINSATYNFADSYAEFTITDGIYRFKLRVVRPFKDRRDRFRGKDVDDLGNAIPIRYSGRYWVRVMDESGVHTHSLDKDNRSAIMDSLYKGLVSGNDTQAIHIDDLKYCIYTRDCVEYHLGGRFYYVDKGNKVDGGNLIFRFLSLEDDTLVDIPLVTRTLTEQGRQTQYLILDFHPQTDGVVLQSIYDDSGDRVEPFRCYRPSFVSKERKYNNPTQRREKRVNRLCQYVKGKDSLISEATFKHFEAAHTCGCYFGALDRLMALVHMPKCLTNERKCDVGQGEPEKCIMRPSLDDFTENREYRFARFYVGYAKYCKDNGSTPYYESLRRMAEEFRFDWIAIKRKVWNMVCKSEDDKQIVIELFKKLYPHYESFIYNYWNIEWQSRRGGASKEQKGAKSLVEYVFNDRASGATPLLVHPIKGVNNFVERLMERN